MIKTKDLTYAKLDSSMDYLISNIVNNGYSNIPILDDEFKVIGVFNSDVLLNLYINNIEISKNTKVADILKFLDLKNQLSLRYIFVSLDDDIDELNDYFNDKEYAYSVIKKSYSILSKDGSLAFLDINDEAKMDIYYKVRFAEIGEEEYKKKYEGLNQLFFSKEEIFNILVKLGFEKIIIEDQNISGYSNNQYRFNAFALKKNIKI